MANGKIVLLACVQGYHTDCKGKSLDGRKCTCECHTEPTPELLDAGSY